MAGWTIGGRVHEKSSVGEVTHSSTIPTLGGLTTEFTIHMGSILTHGAAYGVAPLMAFQPSGLRPWV